MLALEVEFLTGVSVAATPNRREEPEWPPHPDRLFQALVAAWGRDERPDGEERAALEWLEELPTDGLVVSAPRAHQRDVVTVFVPPNDSRTTGQPGDRVPGDLAAAVRVVPESRKNRQPRAFPAVIPAADRPIVRFIWPNANGVDTHRDALARLVAQVTYLGHSHSLVRVSIVDKEVSSATADDAWLGTGPMALRLPHKNRLRHLGEQFEVSKTGRRTARPNPSLATKRIAPPKQPEPATTLFNYENVTIFADEGGFVPEVVAFPLVAKRLRDALLKLAPQTVPIPALLSGHAPNRRPTADPHIAIVPLADVGWPYSQGRLMGLALVWPRHSPMLIARER